MTAPHRIADLLGQAPLFSGMSAQERLELAASVQDRRYAKGDPLFAEGEPAHGMFVIMHGLVKIFQLAPDGREAVLHLIHPGQTCTEAAVLQRASYPAHGLAMSETRALYIPAQTLLRTISSNPDLALRMLAGLSNRLREFTRMLGEQQRGTAVARLAVWLLHNADAAGTPDIVRLDVSRETLGNMLGLTRETLSRALSRLRETGVIAVQGREIHLLDRQTLHSLAEGKAHD